VGHSITPVILVTVEAEIGRIVVQSQLGKKVCKIRNKKAGHVMHTYHPSYEQTLNRRVSVQASPGINVRPYLKNN
jgi:hypothetical protein